MLTSFLHRIRRKPDLIFYGGVFLVFLVTGLRGGYSIGSSGLFETSLPAMSNSPEEPPPPTDWPATGQRNLLVIGIDNLTAPHPRLESIWLLMYFPGQLDLTWLPLYPQPGSRITAQDIALAEQFSIDKDRRPSRDFLQQLTSQAWWNNFLILDQEAMIALVDLVGGVPSGEGHLQGAQALSGITSSRQDAAAAHSGQAWLLSELCQQTQVNPLSIESIASTINRLKSNLATDLDFKMILDEQQGKEHAVLTLQCDFPLSTSSVP